MEYYKARYVAKGFNQRPGFDYLEIFNPTMYMSSIRAILALAIIHNFHLSLVDIFHAYLNGTMDVKVYMSNLRDSTNGIRI